jgi:exonuclease III
MASLSKDKNGSHNRPIRSKDLRSKDHYFNVVTHNINGLKRKEKLDFIVQFMKEKTIDVYCLQETWLEGEQEQFSELTLNNYLVFMHGNKDKTCARGKGGVAIILSPRAAKAWKNAGNPAPVLGGIVAGCVRFMGIRLSIHRPSKTINLFIVSAYIPDASYPTNMTTEFFEKFDIFLNNTPVNHNLIICADTNTSLGVQSDNTDKRFLGKQGNKYCIQNQNYDELSYLLLSHNLRANSTDFVHQEYTTWTSFNPKNPLSYQIDHIFSPNTLRRFVMNCSVSKFHAESDHAAVLLKLRFYFPKNFKKIMNKLNLNKSIKQTIKHDWRKLVTDNNIKDTFKKEVDTLIGNNNEVKDIKQFHDIILEAADNTIPLQQRLRTDWFHRSRDQLMIAIRNRNNAYTDLKKHPHSTEKMIFLRQMRKNLKDNIKQAKNLWLEEYAEYTTKKNFTTNPKEAWDSIKKIQEGFEGHHTKKTYMRMKTKEDKYSTTDKENIEVFGNHFQNVFNGEKPIIDIETVVSQIKKRPTEIELSTAPTIDEVKIALKNMMYDKSPGPSGISPNTLKVLSDDACICLQNILSKCFLGEHDPEAFHEASLKVLFKKGDSSIPSNWRPICLKELTAKLLSSIINQRLLLVLKKHGVEYQSGAQKNRGCVDGNFALKTATQIRRHHNQTSWILFTDLMKAFDSVHHDLLYAILAQYGIPPELINAIKILYSNMFVNLQIGQESVKIPYTIGVQQGDPMAPVLFIFLMQAFAEVLEKKWSSNWDIEALKFNYMLKGDSNFGRLNGQNPKAKGVSFSLFYLLYIDDGVFMFNSREDLIKGTNMLYDLFKMFGLSMHIGENGKKSKTEAMYISPSFIEDANLIDVEKFTSPIAVKHGYVNFTSNFKYLGSIISNDLKDDLEIDSRIKKASAQVGALKNFFKNKHVSLKAKFQIFQAIPINTVLWGCESWAMSEIISRKLQVFYHKSIRKILNINMFEVEQDRITNQDLRKRFCNAPCLLDIISKRQLNWIGKVARMDPYTRLPRKLLAAWTNNNRKVGRPQISYKNTYESVLNMVLPQLPKGAPLIHWLKLAKEPIIWKNLIKVWWQGKTSMNTL